MPPYPFVRALVLAALMCVLPLAPAFGATAATTQAFDELRARLANADRDLRIETLVNLTMVDLLLADQTILLASEFANESTAGDDELAAIGGALVCRSHLRNGAVDAARDTCASALERATAAGRPAGLFAAERVRAGIMLETGDVREAVLGYRRALEHAQARDDRRGEAVVLNNLAAVAQTRGFYQEASGYYAEAIRLIDATGDTDLRTIIGSNFAYMLIYAGDAASALEQFEEVLDSAREGGNVPIRFAIEAGIADARRLLGDAPGAIRELERLVVDIGPLTDINQRGMARQFLARARLDAGQPGEAEHDARQAVSMLRDFRARLEPAQVELAEILRINGRLEEALALVDGLVASAERGGRIEVLALAARSRILADLGRDAEAYDTLRRSVAADEKLALDRAQSQLTYMRAHLEADHARRRAEVDAELKQIADERASDERRERLVVFALLAMFAAGLASLVWLQRKRHSAELAARAAEERVAEDASLKEQLEREIAARTRDLKEQLEQRHALEAALAGHQRLEAIGQLTGGVAHDFNNLMTVVQHAAELLRARSSVAGDAEARALVDEAAQAASAGAAITRQLLAFARQQSLNPVPTDLERFAAEHRRFLEHSLGEGIELAIEVEAPAPVVCIDPAQLTTALLNLAINARDAMRGQGRVKLTIARIDLSKDETGGRGLAPGSHVAISLADSGCGMDAEVMRRAVEPFFSTKPTSAGVGLGLSMVHGFVMQSGGDLRIASRPGVGTTVTMLLPAAAPAGRPEAAAQAAGSGHFAGRRALLVEDNAQLRGVLQRSLADLGFTVQTAASADEARAMLMAGARPDVLFSDIRMPGSMNGRELADWVTGHVPGVRVLLQTGFAATDLNGHAVLHKPFTGDELQGALEGLLGPASTTGAVAR